MSDDVDKRLDKHGEAIKELDRRTTKHDARMDAMEKQMSAVAEDVNSTKTTMISQHTETMRRLAEIHGEVQGHKQAQQRSEKDRRDYIALAALAVSVIFGVVVFVSKITGVW